MKEIRQLASGLVLATLLAVPAVQAQQDPANMPKYGGVPRTEAQKASDREFLATMDRQFKRDRKKAAREMADRGWKALRQGQPAEAMRSFNQAWLLDNRNGMALWGMAAMLGSSGKGGEALKLLAEAEPGLANDLDFAVDHARALGLAGLQTRNEPMVRDALNRFAAVHQRAPQHTRNLQNWAITLYGVGQYPLAWSRIQLAEATPGRAELDQAFVAALQKKMPRPPAQ